MNRNEQLRTANPVQAERLLAARLSGDAKSRLINAFCLASAALGDEPEEWPTQLIARLQSDNDPAVRGILEWVAETRDGCWLEPVRTPLIPAGGPITKIIDAGTPYMNGRTLVWSKDRRAITSFCGTAFRTWDISANREVGRLELPIEWGRAAISNPPRNAFVAVAQRQLLLVNFKSATADVIYTGGVIESIAISADGGWAVSTSVPPDWDYFEHDWNGPRTFRLFDLRRQCCTQTWQAHTAVITDLALSADGKLLASTSRDQTAQLFELRLGSLLGRWRSTRKLTAVAITPSGRRLAYVSEGGVLTVRERDGEIVGRYMDVGAAEHGCLALSGNGHRVVMAGDGGWVSIVDLPSGKRFGPFVGTQPYLDCLAIDSDARHAITGEHGRQLVQWDLTRVGKAVHTGPWISGIWASGNEALVHGDGLSLWDLSTGRCTKVHSQQNSQVAAAPAAGLWAVATWAPSSGGRIRIGKWGHQQTTPFFHTRGVVNSIAISRNGARLVATVHLAPNQGECRVLNLTDKQTVWQRSNLGLGVRSYLSPSGRYLALCSLQGHLEIVDLDTAEVLELDLPQSNIGPVLFAFEDDCILVQQSDQTALLNWRTNSLRTLLPESPSSLSEDGQWIVTTSNNRKLTLWSLPEERRVATFTLDMPVLHTALSPDGKFLTAGDQNGNVHILKRQG